MLHRLRVEMGLTGEVRPLRPQDVEEAYRIETEGYPADEPASYDQLIYRQREAGDLFLGYFEGTQLLGYICSTRYCGERMQKEAMKNHIPSGESICLHSVCVDKERRREGIALHLLEQYVRHARKTQTGAERCLLICKAELIPLYTRAGFVFVGKSSIVHGKQTWFDMEQKL